jgi:hypothetical protein
VLIATSSFEQHGYKVLVAKPMARPTTPASRPGGCDLGTALQSVKGSGHLPAQNFSGVEIRQEKGGRTCVSPHGDLQVNHTNEVGTANQIASGTAMRLHQFLSITSMH